MVTKDREDRELNMYNYSQISNNAMVDFFLFMFTQGGAIPLALGYAYHAPQGLQLDYYLSRLKISKFRKNKIFWILAKSHPHKWLVDTAHTATQEN